MNRLIGTELRPDEQRTFLGRVGIETEAAGAGEPVIVALEPGTMAVDPVPGEALAALVPTWRRDLAIEADVSEEVARVGGYEAVPASLPHTEMPRYRRAPLEVRDAVRDALAGGGLSEVVTYALVAPDRSDRLGWPGDAGPRPGGPGSG